MRNEMLNELKLEDLQGEARELAETIGMDAFRRLVDVYGGTGRVYIPQADKLLIPIRDRLIRDEYNGSNVYALCKKWNLSEGYVRGIVREKTEQIQPFRFLTFSQGNALIEGLKKLTERKELEYLHSDRYRQDMGVAGNAQ